MGTWPTGPTWASTSSLSCISTRHCKWPKRVNVAGYFAVKGFSKNLSMKGQCCFPDLAMSPPPPLRLSQRAEKEGKRFFPGNVETGKSCFFLSFCFCQRIPVTNIQCGVLLLHRKIQSFARISQVMWLLVICVLNLKLEIPGYGWLILESTGKEHFRRFLASELIA